MRLLLKIGCALTAVLLVMGLGVTATIPVFMDFTVGREAEVLHIVNQLSRLETDYQSWNGSYLAVDQPFPRAKHAVDGNPAWYSWGNDPLSNLGFYPEEDEMYGVYWVDSDGSDFTAHGLIEIDGELRHYTSTPMHGAQREF